MLRGETTHFEIELFSHTSVRSAPINIEDIGSVYFRLGSSEHRELIRADVKIDGATIFVIFSPATEGYPFLIENGTDFEFKLWQRVYNIPFLGFY